MMETPEAFSLSKTFIHLRGEAEAVPLLVDDQFWTTINERKDLGEGRLVMVSHMDRDWDHWEMHPAGEEVLFLLWGSMDLVLDLPEGLRTKALPRGHAYIVPQGVWHRAEVHQPSNLLTITPGRGTAHRPV